MEIIKINCRSILNLLSVAVTDSLFITLSAAGYAAGATPLGAGGAAAYVGGGAQQGSSKWCPGGHAAGEQQQVDTDWGATTTCVCVCVYVCACVWVRECIRLLFVSKFQILI